MVFIRLVKRLSHRTCLCIGFSILKVIWSFFSFSLWFYMVHSLWENILCMIDMYRTGTLLNVVVPTPFMSPLHNSNVPIKKPVVLSTKNSLSTQILIKMHARYMYMYVYLYLYFHFIYWLGVIVTLEMHGANQCFHCCRRFVTSVEKSKACHC